MSRCDICGEETDEDDSQLEFVECIVCGGECCEVCVNEHGVCVVCEADDEYDVEKEEA